jgi:hypothetical protein
MLTRHTEPGDSHGQRCDVVSSDEWFPTFRRIVLPSPSTASKTKTRRHSSFTSHKTQSSSLCANVFRKMKKNLMVSISRRGLECADFDLHAPTNYDLTGRQIYRRHPQGGKGSEALKFMKGGVLYTPHIQRASEGCLQPVVLRIPLAGEHQIINTFIHTTRGESTVVWGQWG